MLEDHEGYTQCQGQTRNQVKASEQRGNGTVLVISDEDFNQTMPVVTILLLTSLKKGAEGLS